jgi:ATP-binding cassette subfamily B protein/subfamily B ATP-binding cassette protein MsbA
MTQPVSSKQRERAFRRDGGRPAPRSSDPPKPVDRAIRRRYIRQYIHWLWPYRWGLAGVFLLSLVAAGLDMIWPLAIKHIIDNILPAHLPWPRRLVQLNWLGLGIIALLLLKQAADSTRAYRMAVLNIRIVFRLRQRLFDRMLSLSLGRLSELKSGGIVSRLSSDVDSVSGLVQMAVISPGVAVIRIILTVGVLLALSWRLAVAAMVALPPLALMSYLWLRKVRPIYRSAQQDRQDVDARVNEIFGGVRIVRSFRREKHEQYAYGISQNTIIRKLLRAQGREIALEGLWGILIPATSLLIVWYGGYLILRGIGNLGVGDIFAFQIFAVLLLQPVFQIVASISQTQKSLAAMERVFESMEAPPDKPDAPDAIDAPDAVERIQFDRVMFEYRPGVPVIEDFNLIVPGGSTVALVGPSGAGKTTLTDLVARFYDPTAGAVLLNGVDLRRFKLQSYRRLLAVVQQETFLFDGTVRENISYGRRGATIHQIIDAARRANAHEFIDTLPEAYDTIIGERGFKLSGGQRQRLSIARAILADPQILILDEATSNLDTESEQLIQSSLAELFKGRTTFVIAHRLSTITHANLIVVLDRGRIREAGPHDLLMRQRGLYHDMVERQRTAFGFLNQSVD